MKNLLLCLVAGFVGVRHTEYGAHFAPGRMVTP
jgi:hypothetical protein